MKILKRIAIVLGALVVVYLVVAMVCSSTVHVERSMVINADSKTVYDQVNTLQNWKSWSYWDNIDTAMVSKYEGPAAGVGAKHSWESNNDSVGKGTLTITKAEEGRFVETELYFDGMGTSLGGWKIRDTTEGVLVTTYMDMEIPFLMRPMMAMMDMDAMLGSDFSKSLSGLKMVAEEKAKASAVPQVKIEATTAGPMKVLTIKDSCTEKDISEKLGALYGEIGQVMGTAGATQAGAPFAIYHKVEKTPDGGMKFWLEAGIPVDKEVKSSGRVNYWEMPGGNVVKAWHYGSYESTEQTHETIDAWMKANNKAMAGAPWEVYVTDPGKEPDQSKWLTEIYYPVQ